MVTLRDRCRTVLQRINHLCDQRNGECLDHLTAFVMSEVGRKSDPGLDEKSALVLYFADSEERKEFIRMWKIEHPLHFTKEVP